MTETLQHQDETLKCTVCAREFTFSAGEQHYYYDVKGWDGKPKRCRDCRGPYKDAMKMRDLAGLAMKNASEEHFELDVARLQRAIEFLGGSSDRQDARAVEILRAALPRESGAVNACD
ncbi:MAG TPA: zinc-ribbon domain-containing protein [Candidatus Cybelea sp.]